MIYTIDRDGLWFALVSSSANRDRLVLPAGGQEINETLWETAHREAMEEAGIRVECHSPMGTYWHVKGSGRRVLTELYLAEAVEVQGAIEDRDLYWMRTSDLQRTPFELADGVSVMLMRAERMLLKTAAA